ncbi:type IX secretion system membrane protein PorP/SprF [Bacteroidota bacterium]
MRFHQLYFGYAFDYMLSSIQKHTYGSHEIVIALKLGDNARRYRWLDRY